MSTSSAFVDVNVLLTVAFSREGEETAAAALHGVAGRAAVSALTVHIFAYFARKAYALATLQDFFAEFRILSVTSEDVAWALTNTQGEDFEDGLQLACAIRNGCSEFITFDKSIASSYTHLDDIRLEVLQVE